jgi:hypothetical protein
MVAPSCCSSWGGRTRSPRRSADRMWARPSTRRRSWTFCAARREDVAPVVLMRSDAGVAIDGYEAPPPTSAAVRDRSWRQLDQCRSAIRVRGAQTAPTVRSPHRDHQRRRRWRSSPRRGTGWHGVVLRFAEGALVVVSTASTHRGRPCPRWPPTRSTSLFQPRLTRSGRRGGPGRPCAYRRPRRAPTSRFRMDARGCWRLRCPSSCDHRLDLYERAISLAVAAFLWGASPRCARADAGWDRVVAPFGGTRPAVGPASRLSPRRSQRRDIVLLC